MIITGGIPTEIGKLGNLEMLSISSASLTGTIPISVFKLVFLKVINLSNNSLTGNIPAGSSYGLPNIEHIYLSSNHLTGIYTFVIMYLLDLDLLLHFNGFWQKYFRNWHFVYIKFDRRCHVEIWRDPNPYSCSVISKSGFINCHVILQFRSNTKAIWKLDYIENPRSWI